MEGLINLAATSKRMAARLRTRDMIQSEALTTSAERLQLAVSGRAVRRAGKGSCEEEGESG